MAGADKRLDELDRKLLLCIQSACNTLGVKLPWGEIADLMSNYISDGAIVQHLAKMRARAVELGLEVPPPLRRGGTTGGPKVVRNHAKTKSVSEARSEKDEDEHNSESKGKVTRQGAKAGAQKTANSQVRIKKEPKSDLDTDDSDEDYFEGNGPAKKKTLRRRTVKTRAIYKSESGDEGTKETKDDKSGPFASTENKGSPESSSSDESDSSDDTDTDISRETSNSSSVYVAAGASFLQFPNDRAPDGDNNNRTTTTPGSATENNGASLSTGESKASMTKVVKLQVPKQQLEHVTSSRNETSARLTMGATGNHHHHGDNNPMTRSINGNSAVIGVSEIAQQNSAWIGNFSATIPNIPFPDTGQFVAQTPGWVNSTNVSSSNGFPLPSFAPQIDQGATQFQNPYTPMPTSAAPSMATQDRLFQDTFMGGRDFMAMNNLDSFHSSGTLESNFNGRGLEDLFDNETSFDGKQATPPPQYKLVSRVKG